MLGGRQPSLRVIDLAKGSVATGARCARGVARLVPVTLGVASRDWIQVVGKIQAGQIVVTKGNERLRPGQEVVIKSVEGT